MLSRCDFLTECLWHVDLCHGAKEALGCVAVRGQCRQVCFEELLTQERPHIDQRALDLIFGGAREMGDLGYRQVFDVMEDEGGPTRLRQ